MNKNLKLGITLMFICTLFTATGQLFFKYSSQTFEWNLLGLLTNYYLIFGFIVYGIGSVLLITALKFGDLSSIYPFVSLTFIWVMLISFFIFAEKINGFKIGAVVFIVLGIIAISGGSNGK
jgi:drug/metabolite transporter (DMT)-like permease